MNKHFDNSEKEEPILTDKTSGDRGNRGMIIK